MIETLTSKESPDFAQFPSAQAQGSVPLDFIRPKGGRRFRLLKLLIGFIVLFAVIVGLAGLAIYAFLLQGPISSDRLRSEAEVQLSQLLGHRRTARIKDAKFAIGRNGLISIDATDVSILEDDRINLGVAGEVSVTVRGLPLLSGRIVAEKVTLDTGQIAIGKFLSPPAPRQGSVARQKGRTQSTVEAGGDAEVGADARPSDAVVPTDPKRIDIDGFLRGMAASLDSLTAAIEAGGLDAVVVTNTKIVDFSDLGLRTQSATLLNFQLQRNVRFQEGLFFSALIETERANVSVSGQWRKRNDEGQSLDLEIRDLDIAEFTPQGDKAYLSANAPFDVRFSAPFDADGTPRQALVQARLGNGRLVLKDELTSRFLGGALNVRFLPEKNQIELERSPLQFDHFQTELVGGFRFPLGNEEGQNKPIFELIANDTSATAYNSKLPAGRAAIRIGGTVDAGWKIFDFDTLNAKLSSGSLAGSGVLENTSKGVGLALKLSTKKLDVREFKQFWPPMIAVGARKWAFDGLKGGTMQDARVMLDFPAGSLGEIGDAVRVSEKQLFADVPIVGTTIKTINTLPSIVNAKGKLRQRGMDTFVDLASGTVPLSGDRSLKIGESQLKLLDFSKASQPLEARLKLSGSAQALADIGARKPLSFSQVLGVGPGDVKGKVSGDVTLKTSLKAGGKFGKVDWNVNAKVSDFSSSKPIEGNQFSKADLTIKANHNSADIKGTASVNGVPAVIAMVEKFGSNSGASKRSVTLSLNDAERKKLGIDTGEILTGVTDVSIISGANGARSFDVDLRHAKLALPWLGWSKGKGIPATATFDLQTKGKTQTIKNLRLRGKGFRANGAITVDSKGLVRADMDGVKLNQTDDIDLDVKRVAGGFDVRVNARSYDGRAIIRSLMDEAGSSIRQSGGGRVRIRGKIGKLIGFQKQVLRKITLDYVQSKGRVESAKIDALAEGGAATQFVIEPGASGQVTKLDGRNAGAILRFLDIYSKVRGGVIQVKLTSKGQKRRVGRITASNFILLDEPRLGELLQPPGRLPNTRVEGDRVVKEITKVDPHRVKVENVLAEVEMRPKTLFVHRGRLRGGDAGAAFEGTIYDPNNRVNITGTFLPAYGLNSFVSKIPLLGLAFGSGRSQGLIGITFRLRGPYKNPQLVVNPISLLTPGVFRKLFEF